MDADDFDRIATDADNRSELYEQLGMHHSAAAAANTAEKARTAADCRRTH